MPKLTDCREILLSREFLVRWLVNLAIARLLDGRWFRVLTVIDQFTRECLLLLADSSLTGHKVALALSQVVAERGAPVSITVDNGGISRVVWSKIPPPSSALVPNSPASSADGYRLFNRTTSCCPISSLRVG
jgi:transposase InsO family protein